MKLFIILSTFAVITARICSAAPIIDEVEVVSSYSEINENSYRFGYVLSDGQTREEEGELVQVEEEQVMRVTGSYSFIGDDGIRYVVNYIADENGYQPTIQKVADSKFLPPAETRSSVNSILAKTVA